MTAGTEYRASDLIDYGSVRWDSRGVERLKRECERIGRNVTDGIPAVIHFTVASDLLEYQRFAEFVGQRKCLMDDVCRQNGATALRTQVDRQDLVEFEEMMSGLYKDLKWIGSRWHLYYQSLLFEEREGVF